MKLAAVLLLVCALLVGCGGGGQSSTAPAPRQGAPTSKEGTPKKTGSPNAPSGSKVVACSGGGSQTVRLRATEVDCGTARATMQRWERGHACVLGSSSRGSCSVDGFRCQAVRVDRGAAVSCSRPGADVSFIAKRGKLTKSGSG